MSSLDIQDCPDGRQPDEPSAFSFHNVASGPFYDPAKDGESSKKQRPRRAETFLDLERVPDDVGRMGKEKSRSRLGKILQDKAADDDQDDWFAKRGGTSGRAFDKKAPPTGPRGKTFNFGQGFRDRRDLQQPATGSNPRAPPSLLSRLSDTYNDSPNGASSSSNNLNKRKRERQRSPDRHDSRSGDRRDRWKDDRGDYRKDHRSGGGGHGGSHGGSSRHWEKSHSRREGHGGGGGGGPRYRGSYK